MTNEEDDKTKFVANPAEVVAQFEVPPDATGLPNESLQEPAEPSPTDVPAVPSQADADPDATVLEAAAPIVVAAAVQTVVSPAQPRSRIGIGDILKDRFEILENLGEGGMGMVFKAQDLRKIEARSRNPYTAIKVLNPALAKNELLVAGLQRECEKAQELSHPNIITVYDFDRDGDLVYMSMEYLAGQSLSQIIREAAPAGGISVSKAWPLIKQMALALAYAHTRNIVHSDFKPANVVITHGNDVKVLDFGIAARTEKDHDHDATVFNARAEGGHTPPYASFEMMNGANADPRDDIYAFGLVVYEMLTGRHPYQRKPASEVFIEQQKGNNAYVPEPVKNLTRRQWAALRSAIEILQDKRPKNLESWLEQFDPKAAGGIPTPWLVGGAITVLGLAGFGLYYFASNEDGVAKTLAKASAPVTQQPGNPATAAETRLPIANAGNEQQAKVGNLVTLSGISSQSGDGEALHYAWRLFQLPSGSTAFLQNSTTANPQFIADKPGEYVAELVVQDGHKSSQPIQVKVRVEADKPVSLHEASSADGTLSLAASKAKYRIGEQLKLSLKTTKSGYVRLVYVGATGEVSEILPNPFQPSKVNGNTEYTVPPKGKFKLQVTGPEGIDRIIAVYSDSPITNLEKAVDSDGELAQKYRENATVVTVQYDVVK